MHDRTVDFGPRIHVIVRETEAEAHVAADRFISKLDPEKGKEIRARSIDVTSTGVARQDAQHAASGDLWLEPNVWSGIGLARSGCGSALVGSPDQIVAKLERYIVLPRLETCRVAKTLGRLPDETPVTPLTTKPRR